MENTSKKSSSQRESFYGVILHFTRVLQNDHYSYVSSYVDMIINPLFHIYIESQLNLVRKCEIKKTTLV